MADQELADLQLFVAEHLTLEMPCSDCSGEGYWPAQPAPDLIMKSCSRCGGTGTIMAYPLRGMCPRTRGYVHGKLHRKDASECYSCQGRGWVPSTDLEALMENLISDTRQLKTEIDPGYAHMLLWNPTAPASGKYEIWTSEAPTWLEALWQTAAKWLGWKEDADD